MVSGSRVLTLWLSCRFLSPGDANKVSARLSRCSRGVMGDEGRQTDRQTEGEGAGTRTAKSALLPVVLCCSALGHHGKCACLRAETVSFSWGFFKMFREMKDVKRWFGVKCTFFFPLGLNNNLTRRFFPLLGHFRFRNILGYSSLKLPVLWLHYFLKLKYPKCLEHNSFTYFSKIQPGIFGVLGNFGISARISNKGVRVWTMFGWTASACIDWLISGSAGFKSLKVQSCSKHTAAE